MASCQQNTSTFYSSATPYRFIVIHPTNRQTAVMTKTNAIATKSHHVTPHTTTQTKRPKGMISAGGGNNHAKRGKYGHYHNKDSADDKYNNKSVPPLQPMDLDNDTSGGVLVFDRLDPSDPVHDHRIKQRIKMITKGKNTAGYDNYLQQVPKNRRKIRSLKTPSTPDATLDISAKRWNGLVRAWRKSLHQYDPQDLVNSLSTSMTLSKGGDVNSSRSSSSSSYNKTPSSSTTTTTTTAKQTTIENMIRGCARTPSVNKNNNNSNNAEETTMDDDFLPNDESSPISLLSAADSDCHDVVFGNHNHDDSSKKNSIGSVFSTTARKNLVAGGEVTTTTRWGDLDSSDDDDDDLL